MADIPCSRVFSASFDTALGLVASHTASHQSARTPIQSVSATTCTSNQLSKSFVGREGDSGTRAQSQPDEDEQQDERDEDPDQAEVEVRPVRTSGRGRTCRPGRREEKGSVNECGHLRG